MIACQGLQCSRLSVEPFSYHGGPLCKRGKARALPLAAPCRVHLLSKVGCMSQGRTGWSDCHAPLVSLTSKIQVKDPRHTGPAYLSASLPSQNSAEWIEHVSVTQVTRANACHSLAAANSPPRSGGFSPRVMERTCGAPSGNRPGDASRTLRSHSNLGGSIARGLQKKKERQKRVAHKESEMTRTT